MQYLLLDHTDTLVSISKIIGNQNIDLLLAENGLSRTPYIGRAWRDKCSIIISTSTEVSGSRKSALLNGLVGSEEIFEKACLMDEDQWKVFSATQAFTDALRIPGSIQLPFSSRIIGDSSGDITKLGNASGVSVGYSYNSSAIQPNIGTPTSASVQGQPVNSVTYRAVMETLKQSDIIDSNIFNTVNISPATKGSKTRSSSDIKVPQYAFNLPWGKIQLYSSILQETIDFPAYPEQIETARHATYTAMPDIIYQYEPWIMYQNSGPREQSLSFHLHRDLWSGNHLDGRANELIRFCESNTFPEYNGSAVNAPIVRLYIDGSLFISGVMTATNVQWTGPIGLDNWWLEFTLSLTIQEVSSRPLNIRTVRSMGLKGDW